MKKRVYVIYTGGTIGMQKTPQGYAPTPGYLRQQMTRMPELSSPEMPEYVVNEYDPLLDSSDMTPADWLKIARDVADRYDDFDGIVVLHGTDTMAYTASALAFMLSGLTKPVILTGSQIPLWEVRNDARENLITALLLAAHYPIPEVCLYFGDRLLRGCRATKVDAGGFEGFISPNFPALGQVGVDIHVAWEQVRPPAAGAALKVQPVTARSVASLRLFPGIQANMVRNLLQPPLMGLVLEAYGVGNGPTRDQEFMRVLAEAIDAGVIVIDRSQCLRGTVNLAGYATGSALAEIGVISGYDLTAEAALTKLMFLLSLGLETVDVKRQMQLDLAGELTRPA